MKKMKFLSMTLLATIVLSSCSNDDDNVPTVVNEEEVITTITATFTPVNGGASMVANRVMDRNFIFFMVKGF